MPLTVEWTDAQEKDEVLFPALAPWLEHLQMLQLLLGREVNMTGDLMPELGHRKREASGAFRSIEEVVKNTSAVGGGADCRVPPYHVPGSYFPHRPSKSAIPPGSANLYQTFSGKR